MKLIEKIMTILAVLLVIAIPFLIHNQIKKANQCEQSGGLLIKTASGWDCVELRKAQEK